MHIEKLRSCGQILPQPHWALGYQVHDFHECLVVLNGRIQVQSESGTIRGASGDILLYPSGCWHTEKSDSENPAEFIFLGFWGRAGDYVRCFHDHRGRCRQLATWLLDEHLNDRMDSPLFHRLAEHLAAEVTEAETLDPENTNVDTIRRAIINDPAKHWSLEELAGIIHLSPSYFCRRYKQLTGITPMQELKRLRIRVALNLIQGTDLPLKVIASRCGFSNAYHFSRVCREESGHPPSHFRKTQS